MEYKPISHQQIGINLSLWMLWRVFKTRRGRCLAHFFSKVLPHHSDTTQHIYHLQRCMRLIEPKRRAAHHKLQNHVSPKGLYWTQGLHHDPVSFMKYGEVIASINKSPDKTLFSERMPNYLGPFPSQEEYRLVEMTWKHSCWAGHKTLLGPQRTYF